MTIQEDTVDGSVTTMPIGYIIRITPEIRGQNRVVPIDQPPFSRILFNGIGRDSPIERSSRTHLQIVDFGGWTLHSGKMQDARFIPTIISPFPDVSGEPSLISVCELNIGPSLRMPYRRKSVWLWDR